VADAQRADASLPRSENAVDFTPLYESRFDDEDRRFKVELWRILVEDHFQAYIGAGDTVVDLGAGDCEFINAVRCGRKIAVDLDPRTGDRAIDAEVVARSSDDLAPIESGAVDVVFASNFFEHLPTKATLLSTLGECHRILRPGGKLLILQPNIRYLSGRYWDYLDHHIPLSHVTMVEALELTGFRPDEVVPRFLPYTIKNQWVPRHGGFVRAYLRLKPAWWIFGRQMFVVGVRR
jgi:SAM-dependent methyltransferase